jgi:hypothetical protein
MRLGTLGRQQLQLVLGWAARLSGAGDHGQPVTGQVDGVTGQLDLLDPDCPTLYGPCGAAARRAGPRRGEALATEPAVRGKLATLGRRAARSAFHCAVLARYSNLPRRVAALRCV